MEDLVPARRWRRFWHRTSPSWDGGGELAELDRLYREPHRFYHNWGHIRRCLGELDRIRRLVSDPAAVELALWYHDAVYDPRAADNELRSALLAVQSAHAAGLEEAFARSVSALILSTRVDLSAAERARGGGDDAEAREAARSDAARAGSRAAGSTPAEETAAPTDIALVRDIDLSILGSRRRRYRRYERDIRREYAWVPWDQYRARRGRLLRGFLEREAIYATESFRRRCEGRARLNLRWALERLEGGLTEPGSGASTPGGESDDGSAPRGGRTPPPGRK